MKLFIIISAFAVFLPSEPAHAGPAEDKQICEQATEFEKTLAKELPKPADSMTEIISMRINCSTKTQSWQKMTKVTEKEFALGWKERKQRQHNQLHCNIDGLSSSLGWTVMDQLFDKNFNLIAEFITTPEMCASK